MLNMLSLLLGLMCAVPPRAVSVPPVAPVNVVASVRKTVEPRSDIVEKESAGKPQDSFDEAFSVEDYADKKQALDAKYARRAELREKLAAEIADILADYEEYTALSRSYLRELHRLTGGYAMRENGGEGHAQPDIPEADGRGEENPSGERLPAPPSDGEVPRPVPPQPRLPEKGAGGN